MVLMRRRRTDNDDKEICETSSHYINAGFGHLELSAVNVTSASDASSVVTSSQSQGNTIPSNNQNMTLEQFKSTYKAPWTAHYEICHTPFGMV